MRKIMKNKVHFIMPVCWAMPRVVKAFLIVIGITITITFLKVIVIVIGLRIFEVKVIVIGSE